MASFEYCQKADTRVPGTEPIVIGMPKARRNVAGDVKAKNKLLLDKGAEQAVFDGDIPISNYLKVKNNIEALRASMDKEALDLKEPNSWWFWGPPGCGKSTAARIKCPAAYHKNCNKWWCGMKSSTSPVIIDDFDKERACLGHDLKIWADKFRFHAEYKSGSMMIRPACLIVTSNYRPEDIWPKKENPELLEALQRRFIEVRFV